MSEPESPTETCEGCGDQVAGDDAVRLENLNWSDDRWTGVFCVRCADEREGNRPWGLRVRDGKITGTAMMSVLNKAIGLAAPDEVVSPPNVERGES